MLAFQRRFERRSRAMSGGRAHAAEGWRYGERRPLAILQLAEGHEVEWSAT
jgi:hypothetical protein